MVLTKTVDVTSDGSSPGRDHENWRYEGHDNGNMEEKGLQELFRRWNGQLIKSVNFGFQGLREGKEFSLMTKV